MKLLLISDIEQTKYWQPTPEMFDDVDLILSAGDLKAEYLNRLAEAGRASARRTYLLYVHGNHDSRYPADLSKDCVCVDGDLLTVKGLRILGFGGSLRYRNGLYQYTEEEMRARIEDPFLLRKIRSCNGADIVLTHAPPRGMGDREDPVHRGFECFHTLVDTAKPRYFIHGHVHLCDESGRVLRYGGTTVINASGSYVLSC